MTEPSMHTTGADVPLLSDVPIPDPPRAVLLAAHNANTTGEAPPKLYWDRSHYSSPGEQMKALQNSSTVYVGNLSFTIKTHHIYHHFTSLLSLGGTTTNNTNVIKRIILGVDRNKEKPCGFCFVEFYQRITALRAVSMISGTQLDNKIIRVELDAGYQPGRQYGRGKFGGQVRDEKRTIIQQLQNKRTRTDTETTINNSTTSTTTTRPVRLDEALPSGRNQNDISTVAATGGDNAAVLLNDNNAKNDDNDDDDDDIQPRAKRMKLEE